VPIRPWLHRGFLALVLLFSAPIVASAGPVEDLITSIWPGAEGMAWLVGLAALITAVTAWLTAVLPQGEVGTTWGFVRRILNWFAGNVGNAKNDPQAPGGE
jgi:hypothetical protein